MNTASPCIRQELYRDNEHVFTCFVEPGCIRIVAQLDMLCFIPNKWREELDERISRLRRLKRDKKAGDAGIALVYIGMNCLELWDHALSNVVAQYIETYIPPNDESRLGARITGDVRSYSFSV